MIKKLWRVLGNLNNAYDLLEKEQRKREKEAVLSMLLKEHNLLNPNRVGNPAVDIGSAFELAERFNIKLGRGTSYGNVRAEYPPELFPKGMRFNNWFSNPPPDWVNSNAAHIERRTVQEAVCECVIMCLENELIERLGNG